MSQPAVSHHLALLRHGGIVDRRRQGKNNFYSLTDTGYRLSKIVKGVVVDLPRKPEPSHPANPKKVVGRFSSLREIRSQEAQHSATRKIKKGTSLPSSGEVLKISHSFLY